jgi:hypothetical protein
MQGRHESSTSSMPFRVAKSLAALAVNISLFVPAVGQSTPASPCVNIKPVPGPLGYSLRPGGTRCEGLYIDQVSAPTIEIVGFYAGASPSLKDAASLLISAPGSNSSTIVGVTGVSVAPEVYYRLDTRLTGAQPEVRLNGADVLFQAGLRFSDLAFTGSKGMRLAPLVLSVAAPHDAAPGAHQFVAQLRTNRSIKALYWRIERSGPTQMDWVACSDDLSAPYRMARLRFTATAGEADLVVKAQDSGGNWSQSRTPLALP